MIQYFTITNLKKILDTSSGENPKMMCPTFYLVNPVGAFCERPRTNTVRPYEFNLLLFTSFLDSNCNSHGHTNHGVVTKVIYPCELVLIRLDLNVYVQEKCLYITMAYLYSS